MAFHAPVLGCRPPENLLELTGEPQSELERLGDELPAADAEQRSEQAWVDQAVEQTPLPWPWWTVLQTFAFAGWGVIDPAGWELANVRVFSDLAGAALADLYRA